MEAFAILSVVVNIAQAVDYGFQLIQKSKNLRGFGAINPDLNDDVFRLKTLATGLSSQVLPKSAGELQILATQCAEVSSALISQLEQLEQLEPVDRKSKRQRAKAIWKSERRRSHIRKLERQLKNYRSQLHLHLTSFSTIEFREMLDKMGQDVQKMQGELTAIHFDVKELGKSAHVGEEISRTLQPLVQHYYEDHVQSVEQTILDKLHFPNMHERFDTIIDAHEETLSWLFNPRHDDSDGKGKAREDFVTWLREGNHFFHISGKPGAGKSTMMKYICSHEDLNSHLEVWCRGARLGRGQFFFWMPGTAEQKSLKGLLRGILHSILRENRNLLSVALPDLWKLTRTQYVPSRELEYRDFQQGLENIFKHASHSRLYKFALFIDGLDEFEGRHLELINTMKQWMEKYPSVLKICVSSREYAVFQQSFSDSPKLRLHELTSIDISRMVSARVRSNPEYKSVFTSDKEFQATVDLVTARAEGVFLWVSLVLAGIEDAMISGASLGEVEERIKAYPTELEPLYWHLTNLIHGTDRTWALSALKMVQFFQSRRDNVKYPLSWGISVLELSFLEDTQYDTAIGVSETSTSQPHTNSWRLDNTHKKIYGRCKGFLHVHVLSGDDINHPYMMRQQVVFIHRSIVEFLETPRFIQMAKPYISDFDCFGNACGAFLRSIEQQVISDIFYARGYGQYIISPFLESNINNYLYVAVKTQLPTFKTFTLFLTSLQDKLTTLAKQIESGNSLLERIPMFFALGALTVGILEPSQQMRDAKQWMDHPFIKNCIDETFVLFFQYGCEGCWSHFTPEGFIEAMSFFLSHGLDLNHFVKSSFGAPIASPWRMVAWGFMTNELPQTWCPSVIDWCLRHGADPYLNIGLRSGGTHVLKWLHPPGGWQILLSIESLGAAVPAEPQVTLAIINETTPLWQYFNPSDKALELQGLLSCWFPENGYFVDLIDGLRSDESGIHPESTLLPNKAEMPSWQSMRSTWQTDCRAYSRADFENKVKSMGLGREDLCKLDKLYAKYITVTRYYVIL
ncbi:hypothetical protein GGS24DRAFT_468127 [Hypoxylon argillaceum]|nr:hypothetical protein GGS24DRAFT_468127 [Hypoxylon argillaceum]